MRREICVSKSIGLACSGKEIYHFFLVLLCIRGQIPSTSPPGAYIRRGDLTKGFLRYDFEELIFGGAYAWRGLFSEFYGIRSVKTLPFPFLSGKNNVDACCCDVFSFCHIVPEGHC